MRVPAVCPTATAGRTASSQAPRCPAAPERTRSDRTSPPHSAASGYVPFRADRSATEPTHRTATDAEPRRRGTCRVRCGWPRRPGGTPLDRSSTPARCSAALRWQGLRFGSNEARPHIDRFAPGIVRQVGISTAGRTDQYPRPYPAVPFAGARNTTDCWPDRRCNRRG